MNHKSSSSAKPIFNNNKVTGFRKYLQIQRLFTYEKLLHQ